jgi:hypothetical protein
MDLKIKLETMKRIIILFLAVFTGLMITSSCSKDEVASDTPTLSVNPENVSATTAAGSYTVNITSNVSWTATSSETWCSITPASGDGNGTLTIIVAANTAIETRTATVTVKAGALTKTVTVTQLGATPVLSVNTTEINVPASATDSTIYITSNLAWTATSNETWCLITPTSGNGSGTLTITVAENTAIETRTATITITAGTLTGNVTVTQDATSIVEFTFTPFWSNRIIFNVTAQKLTVDWGDGKIDEYSNTTSVSHAYSDNTTRIIRMKQENLTLLNITELYGITSLNVSGCTELMHLDCVGNQITSLDVSKNAKLTGLRCGSNQLTILDVSKNRKLTILECGGNQLTSLNVTGCTQLGQDQNIKAVYIQDNQLSATALNEIFTALPIVTNNSIIDINDNPGTFTCNKSIATKKGWRVMPQT